MIYDKIISITVKLITGILLSLDNGDLFRAIFIEQCEAFNIVDHVSLVKMTRAGLSLFSYVMRK